MSKNCEHLKEVVDAINNYHVVLAYYVTCIAEGATKRKADDAFCNLCKSASRRIHACLECAFFGCFDEDNGEKSHMEDHHLKTNHCFAININHGCLFCFECKDYIYNDTFEDIFNDYKLETRRINGNTFYMPWRPKGAEIDLLKDRIKKISDDSYIGLRGIANIGNTCYISVIIQVLLHNPVLRDFFLSDKHRCFLKQECLTCEMFVLFQEFYSGISAAFVLTKRFLPVLKKYVTLAKMGDQGCCHSILVQILTGLHKSCDERRQEDNCNCMIHQIFYGINQSSTECSDCKFSSHLPLDHFIDIVLNPVSGDDSLVKILDRKYVDKQLWSDHPCKDCHKVDTTYVSTTFKKLPTVICFRMNFVEIHKPPNPKKKDEAKLSKISTAFSFNEFLDMSPYLISKDNIKLQNEDHESNFDLVENRYQLFAVIFHKGDVEGGHYLTYVRQQQGRWFECDDESVCQRSLATVLACEPYLLFYYKYL